MAETFKEHREIAIKMFIEELPVLRAKIGISQDELAQYVGISRQTYSAIENEKRNVSWTVFLSLLCFFSIQKKTNNFMKLIPGFTDVLSKCLDYVNRPKTK